MKYLSTNRQSEPVSFQEAVTKGMPSDGGLFMPDRIESLDSDFLENIGEKSYAQIGYEVARQFAGSEINQSTLYKLVEDTLSFNIPLVKVSDQISTLELFHGPTMAFKDIGARFMARCLGHFSRRDKNTKTVLVATSGDTGSAVAHGFYEVEGIRVVILYPRGKVSEFQEMQMTRLGKNIIALELNGTFDDCQSLVKAAFGDDEINNKLTLTSANSINIARLIPQVFYYFICYAQIGSKDLVISVPSGNYGNLTAGLIAVKLGLPVKKFIASSNRNDIVPNYLNTGEFTTKASIQTLSNAMDVGNPSNFARMSDLYGGSLETMREDIEGYSFTDDETKAAIVEVRKNYGYTLDPHGAVGYLGLKKYLQNSGEDTHGVFLETAHPSKFSEVVEPVLNENVSPPDYYQADSGPKLSMPLENSLEDLRKALLS